MKKSIHSEAEIIKSVKELEGGIPICRRLEVSRATIYGNFQDA